MLIHRIVSEILVLGVPNPAKQQRRRTKEGEHSKLAPPKQQRCRNKEDEEDRFIPVFVSLFVTHHCNTLIIHVSTCIKNLLDSCGMLRVHA